MKITIDNKKALVKNRTLCDSEGFYRLTLIIENQEKNIVLSEEMIGKTEVYYKIIINGKTKLRKFVLNADEAEIFKNYILNRKLFTFQNWNELGDAERKAPELWGEAFKMGGKLCAYKYAEPYISPEQRKQIAKEKKYKKEAEKAHQVACLLGLPELKGSEKQVIWAEQIRAKYFQDTQKNDINPSAKKVKTAKWWIDNHKSILR